MALGILGVITETRNHVTTKVIRDFINQYKTPTFDELKHMWSEYSEDIEIICEERLLIYDEANEVVLFEYDFETGDCKVDCYLTYLVQVTLAFIEDRIRYLQGQEKENE